MPCRPSIKQSGAADSRAAQRRSHRNVLAFYRLSMARQPAGIVGIHRAGGCRKQAPACRDERGSGGQPICGTGVSAPRAVPPACGMGVPALGAVPPVGRGGIPPLHPISPAGPPAAVTGAHICRMSTPPPVSACNPLCCRVLDPLSATPQTENCGKLRKVPPASSSRHIGHTCPTLVTASQEVSGRYTRPTASNPPATTSP